MGVQFTLPKQLLTVLVFLSLAGCAGYRGGWQSVAYIGDSPPADLAGSVSNRAQPPELNTSGLRLRVSIDNELRTYDTQVYLFALPLGVDPRKVYSRNHEPGKTRVLIHVKPQLPGYTFRPASALLQVGTRRYTAVAGHEFGMWDEQWNRVERGGKWEHRPITSSVKLIESGRQYLLSVDFATPTPSPESNDIVLDLSQALQSQEQPALPPIRFTPVRWKEGYT